jgi:peptidoglycan/xylan/chitin deacetylase (PgdA/CDA1 family)
MKRLFRGTALTPIINRVKHLFLLALLVASMGIACLPQKAAALDLTPPPKVSFTFDDGYESFITQAAPALAASGLTGTAYVTTGNIGTPNFMTWQQTEDLQNIWNWEVGAHTVTHPEVPLLTDAQKDAELRQSKQALADHGIDAVSFATPFGAYDDATQAISARYYTSHRGFHDIGYNSAPYNDQLLVNQQVQIGDGDAAPSVSVAQVKGYIDQAIANNQWLILTFHDITAGVIDPQNSDEAYSYPVASLSEIAQYVASKTATDSITPVTVRDGLLTGTNMMTGGGFDNGIAQGWTTDDPINITANNGNWGSYPGPLNSVSLKSAASPTGNKHLFSPNIAVTSGNSYLIKQYLRMISGTVGFYVDEYDSNGEWISGQSKSDVTYAASGSLNVSNVNFAYTPTSAAVKHARLQVIVQGANTQAYLDTVQWIAEDTTAPSLSAINHSTPTTNATTVAWTTDEASTSRINFGTTNSYGSTVADTSLVTSHAMPLANLAPDTTYHYQVVSVDAAGNTSSSADFTFATAAEDAGPTPIQPGDYHGTVKQYRIFTDSSRRTSVHESALRNGSRYLVSYQIVNTGRVAWQKGGSNPVRLGIANDNNGAYCDISWVACNRPAGLKQDSVAPGQVGTFEFWITTPFKLDGTSMTHAYRIVSEGKTWFASPNLNAWYVHRTPATAWQIVRQSSYTNAAQTTPRATNSLSRGERVYAVIKARNLSGKTWSNTGRNPVRLGVYKDRKSSVCDPTWLSCTRPALMKEQSVAPGEIATFEFWIRTPSNKAINIAEYFTPVVEGSYWLGNAGLYYHIRSR